MRARGARLSEGREEHAHVAPGRCVRTRRQHPHILLVHKTPAPSFAPTLHLYEGVCLHWQKTNTFTPKDHAGCVVWRVCDVGVTVRVQESDDDDDSEEEEEGSEEGSEEEAGSEEPELAPRRSRRPVRAPVQVTAGGGFDLVSA